MRAICMITVLAEAVRAVFKYNWTGDVIATVMMSIHYIKMSIHDMDI